MSADRVAEALAALEAAEKEAARAPWAFGDSHEWEANDLVAPTVREMWEPDALDPDAPLEHAKKVGSVGDWDDADANWVEAFRNAAPALLKLARAAARHEPAPPGWRHDPDCDACAALSELAEAVLG